ncbi:hypothetical protein C7N43_15440 [Sphingobacteriales bacterium UPWRP_1]|nr:hypothetical protein BVG80_07615 [Sphingobacteriales bacterium TSM_CSM]PSJ76114.1 hypothetical protein C7N43_15440 [Sphingobacteriales bacterium UPWRP_1]
MATFSFRKYAFHLLILISGLFISLPQAIAQRFIDERKEHFIFDVKIIDEFIDRFNNAENTLISKNSSTPINRQQALKLLFNKKEKSWDTLIVKRFIDDILNKDARLNFYDKFWYAQLKCQFKYMGVAKEVILTLENQVFTSGASKWLIVGVYAPFLDFSKCASELTIPDSRDITRTMNPMTHATNFVGLKRALEDFPNLKNYYCQSCNSDELHVFANEILNKNLKLVGIDKITYHFLEIDNWIFTVDHFYGNTYHSGWLISSLVEANQNQKKFYKTSKLYLN